MSNTPFHLTGKTILVTGASSGIGKEIAITASKMGATIIITARNEIRLQATLSELSGTNHIKIVADLTETGKMEDLVKSLPNLDGVVLCAGMVEAYPIKYLTQEKINNSFDINFNSTVLLMAALSRQKKINKGGSVVFISSISSSFPPKGGAMYSSAKAAIETFSKVFALENYQNKIRANCISPGMVKTALYDDVEKTVTKESMDAHIANYPLGVGYPEDIANATVFLLSGASRWITGTNMILDGGCILNG